MHRVIAPLVAVLCLVLASCGASKNSDAPTDPVRNVPSEGGIQRKVRLASDPVASDFPATGGKTLQQLADGMVAGPTLPMASWVFTTPGPPGMAFGMIDARGRPVYGPTAIYAAPTPADPAVGP